ncbi:4Fe-4S ferredoxin [Candidatus Symbiopectobacterium sp. NZEC135]|uniref:4Fe-4S ferredoxin n=1 Tax=Candidatus Symbiopectobacterium sp. NZEC135 TaxID=2820471 RepID=UPI002227750B|nr:4Fe-4S ferredoxin [Candidatus Symbiopectobacterium sp. NZEC135]MCW2479348.1 4Fe-4S ferredoxin [Candidatus Symbiopectobacterium sp. NZEC135]
MNFLKILIRNLRQGPATDPFPFGETFTPDALRGRIAFDATRCSVCRMCEHVCAGGAIRFEETPQGVEFILWHNTCTFCGLCEHYCVPKAIHLTNDWHLAHRQEDKYRMTEEGAMPYHTCIGCGASFLAPSAALLDNVYQTPGSIDPALSLRCPDCRRTRAAAQQNTPGIDTISDLGIANRTLHLNLCEKPHD